ncbi:MAG: PD-(D/E)XK nuclease family protein [Elusimicrobia bacterium]|nr:PD-(D/E)XK nuclease family protein [Elusimicrobiota bacterium]
MYEECPMKYKFKYIEKIKEKPKSYFAFGHSIHSAMEFLYAVKSPPFPSLEEVLEFFTTGWDRKSWLEKGYKDAAKAENDFQEGRRMLAAYYKKHCKTLEVPFLLEYESEVETDGLMVKIIADRINYLGKGEILIIDYKTGKDVKREPDQLYMYQRICEMDERLKKRVNEVYGENPPDIKVRNLVYYHVPSLREVAFERAKETEINSFWQRVLSVADRIRKSEFEPNPGEFQCRFCDYGQLCPVYAKNGSFTGEADLSAGKELQGAKLEDMIDEYAELKLNSESMKSRMETLKNAILAAAGGPRSGPLNGRKYSMEIRKDEKWLFKDRENITKVLKETGMYEKTVSPTVKGIVDLLKDGTIPETVKEKIRKAGERVEEVEFEITTLRGSVNQRL